MKIDHEIQLRNQIDKFIITGITNFRNSKKFSSIPHHLLSNELANEIENITTQAIAKYPEFERGFVSQNIPFISKNKFDTIVYEQVGNQVSKFIKSIKDGRNG